MKRVLIISSLLITSILLSSCSNEVNNTKINPTSIISKESYAIIKSLEPNKKIDDFFQIATTLEKLRKDSGKQLSNDLDYLIQKSDEYGVKKVEDVLSSYKEGKLPLTTLKSVANNDDKIRQYKYQYWYSMILPLYTEKYIYEYPLKVNMDSIISIAKSEGYVYDIEDTDNQDKFTWYYKEVTTVNNIKHGKGGSFTVLKDFHGNIMEIFLPPIYGTSFTLNNLPLLLKSADIENNKYMKQILTTDELKKVSVFFNNIDSNVLKSNSNLKMALFHY